MATLWMVPTSASHSTKAGGIARVVLTSAETDPRLVLRLDIVRLGDPGVIAPGDVGTPARSTVSVADLVAAGVEPLELGDAATRDGR